MDSLTSLRHLLPAGDPFRDFDPPRADCDESSSEESFSAVLQPAPDRQQTVRAVGYRRRKTAPWVLMGMCGFLAVALAGVTYLLMTNKRITTEGEWIVAQSGEGTSAQLDRLEQMPIGDGRVESPQPAVAPRKTPRDPVLAGPREGVAGALPRGRGLDPNLVPGSAAGDDSAFADTSATGMDEGMTPGEEMQENQEDEAKDGDAMPINPPAETAPLPPESPEGAPLTGELETAPESMATEPMDDPEQWEPLLEPISELLIAGSYEEVKAAIEKRELSKVADPRGRDVVLGYQQLAEFAMHFREGIRRGSESLQDASTFEITGGIEAIVVEADRESIALKIDGRVRRYALDEVPLVLAERLASFGLPMDDPVSQAARGAYQALWPHATEAHREQAIELWRRLSTETKELSLAPLQSAIEYLYEQSPAQ